VRKESELTGQVPPKYQTTGDIKKGFVYKRVPHVALKSIANNPDIELIAEKWDRELDAQLAVINQGLIETFELAAWQHHEVTREVPPAVLKKQEEYRRFTEKEYEENQTLYQPSMAMA
ncbi:hypothetical protein, partial [Klebsiella pneumoniae]